MKKQKIDYNHLEFAAVHFGRAILCFHRSYELSDDEWRDVFERSCTLPFAPAEAAEITRRRELEVERHLAEIEARDEALKQASPAERKVLEAIERRAPTYDMRIAIVKRDKWSCRYCGISLQDRDRGLHIDHVMPFSKGGKTTMENLVVACGNCNNHKWGRTPEEANMVLLPVP